jgi:hypothetical protein
MIFEASVAFRVETEVRPSTLAGAGDGIFAREAAAKGEFLGMDFPSYRKLCTDRDVPALPEEVRRFSWRHVEHVCFEAHDRRSTADLMNHSFDPNVLWHLGHYFAAREIRAGDELFVDYRYLFAPSWNDPLIDAATGRPIAGLDWRESLIESSRKLVELLEETTATAPKGDLDRTASLCLALRNRQ